MACVASSAAVPVESRYSRRRTVSMTRGESLTITDTFFVICSNLLIVILVFDVWLRRVSAAAPAGEASTMKDSHQKAAEYHDLAAHAHRTAAAHYEKGEHQTGHEHSRQALEHSQRAYEAAQEADKHILTRS